jgi:hypothetical protein
MVSTIVAESPSMGERAKIVGAEDGRIASEKPAQAAAIFHRQP